MLEMKRLCIQISTSGVNIKLFGLQAATTLGMDLGLSARQAGRQAATSRTT